MRAPNAAAEERRREAARGRGHIAITHGHKLHEIEPFVIPWLERNRDRIFWVIVTIVCLGAAVVVVGLSG